MNVVGLVLVLAGAAIGAWTMLLGPMIWMPVGVVIACFGLVLVALSGVRDAVEAAAARIVETLKARPRQADVVDSFLDTSRSAATPLPDVAPTPRPGQRRPSYEELTGKRDAPAS